MSLGNFVFVYNKFHSLLSFRPEIMLIEPDNVAMELGEVQMYPNLEQILADEQWIDDATGLIPHCLSILKTCRALTERLTGLAMSATHTSGSGLNQIIEVFTLSMKTFKKFNYFCRVQEEYQAELMIWSVACTLR